jgi:hypothetical protein
MYLYYTKLLLFVSDIEYGEVRVINGFSVVDLKPCFIILKWS